MATKKNFYYVLVFAEDGAKYVTNINHNNKYAHWDETEKPLAMEMRKAQDISLGLTWNGNSAVVVQSPYELDYQPYNYKDYECKFVKK